MNIYRTFDDIEYDNNTMLTVGTFDGVHKGHQMLLKYLKSVAAEKKLRPLLITIDPHPQIVLQKESKPDIKLLTTIEERIELFRLFGLKNLLIIPFSYEFSRTTPEQFIENYLYQKTGLRHILVGYDHLFGKDRSGNNNLLQEYGKKLDFTVEKMSSYLENSEIISSTKIRQLISGKKVDVANQMLGYDYSVSGKVVRGQGRARSLGYPTANFEFNNPHKLIPSNGVYLVYSYIKDNLYYGMANIGTRPTLTNDKHPTLEVNYFNLDMDLYDDILKVSFLQYIREEQKFDGVSGLLNQIAKDKNTCLRLIKEIKK
jgi:riboflavin kinase/FMN adenylyltransferase